MAARNSKRHGSFTLKPFCRAARIATGRSALVAGTTGEAVEAMYDRGSAKTHQRDVFVIAGLEAHRGSGGNIEPHAECARAIERQPRLTSKK